MRGALLLVTVAGCSVPDLARVPLPPHDGELRSMVLVVTGGAEPAFHATALDGAAHVRPPALLEGETTLEALLYRRTLPILGLRQL